MLSVGPSSGVDTAGKMQYWILNKQTNKSRFPKCFTRKHKHIKYVQDLSLAIIICDCMI